MIIFKQKEFNDSVKTRQDLYNNLEEKFFSQAALNILKAIEMMNLDDGEYVFHWIRDRVVKHTIKPIMTQLKDAKPVPQLCLLGADPNVDNIIDILGWNTYSEKYQNKYGENSDDFIKFTIERVLTETKRGTDDEGNKMKDPKYKRWFDDNGMIYNSSAYQTFFKYISLSLSGQIDPRIVNPRDRIIHRLDIDYSKSAVSFYDERKLTTILFVCISKILEENLSRKPKDLINEFGDRTYYDFL